jgi:hypothetical protein
MSPWILILVWHIGFGTAAVTVDMPDEETCRAAADHASTLTGTDIFWCIHREPQR